VIWAARLWDHDIARKAWLAVLVLWVMVAPVVIVYQSVEIKGAQANTHALQASIDKGLHHIGPLLTQGQLVLIEQLAWLECAQTKAFAACGAPPPLPDLHVKSRS
jgi:hypothetical protein